MRGDCASNDKLTAVHPAVIHTAPEIRARPGGWPGMVARFRRPALQAAIDAVAWTCGLLMAGLATSSAADLLFGPGDLVIVCAVTWTAAVLAGATCGLYSGRYQAQTGAELSAVLVSAGLTGLLLEGVCQAGLLLVGGRPAVLGFAALVGVLAMITARAAVAAIRRRPRRPAPTAVKVIVFGAGSAGTQLVQRLAGQPGARYRPVALLDDDPGKRRLRICGIRVRGGRDRLAEVAAETGATVMVIAIAGGCRDGQVISQLITQAESIGLVTKVIPRVEELVAGPLRIDDVRDPRITHLLGRAPIRLDLEAAAGQFAGRRILVTGAGGSIGSELCRQLHRLGPASLVMLDRDESALHAIQLALHGRALLDSDEVVLADITDAYRVREVFAQTRPEIVFHTAAVKHLPLLERYPAEALKTNVSGTLNVLQAAADCGVQSFVNVSTDKAADPVSVLGTSKRITERLTAHMAAAFPGTWVSVRFGNVLGSRGSLLGSLSAQIAAGGPVTVTHPQVARYFMTATEAVQLVLQAVAVGDSGEVLVLDMGDQVRIVDLARRMADTASRHVEIVFTGLRPGEKLTEDLLGKGEPDHRPRHPLVRQVPVPALDAAEITAISHLTDPDAVRAVLARLAVAPGPEQTTGQSVLPGQPEKAETST
ncbi:SDR family NAD(P)-dependent oxidoreductase [Streptomyces indiaensis]|uniref:Polysaccharide biosynthesis protein CapD-like domain-containing protein n=1 Tax=Streptomyces indiaensis TaxID=284033 RepID=A0ABN3E3M9_9ACTN|nr:SDR family NAD(P)-dependent oxidoreductase [Streptomyces indiaensis]MCF1645395.1 SDR family NAD(P)-dependent oxidoreductase [Streptomyces indiaensis]